MKQKLLSGVVTAAAAAIYFLSQTAGAAPVNVTILNDDTVTVPIAIAPPAPIAGPNTFGTTFTNVVGNNLSPTPVYRSPFEGTGQFATGHFSSVEGPPPIGGSSATYALFGTTLDIFWGSVDQYNTLTFYDGATAVGSITGGDLSPIQFGLGHDWVRLLVDSAFDSVVVSSSINAFEFSNISACGGEGRACAPFAPTPLPAALPLFASAFAGIGGLLGWRKRRKAKAIAA